MSSALVHFPRKQRYTEFKYQSRFNVRAASTANIVLATGAESGDSFGGVTLASGDFILLKNQTTAAENGIYIVQISGVPVRHTSYDSPEELYLAHIWVTAGTNANTRWFQTVEIDSLLDAQTWSSTPPTLSFVVPPGIHQLRSIVGCGGGAGGRAGGTGVDGSNFSGNGGGGGAGATPQTFSCIPVTPGATLSIDLGYGGASSTNGTSTIVTGFPFNNKIILPGGSTGTAAGAGGGPGVGTGGDGGATYILNPYIGIAPGAGADGGGGATTNNNVGTAGSLNQYTPYVNTFATSGTGGAGAGGGGGGGGGGAGGPGFGPGGNGGNGANNGGSGSAGSNATNYGAGGGGGGGGGEAGNAAGGAGGFGGDGYLRFEY